MASMGRVSSSIAALSAEIRSSTSTAGVPIFPSSIW
jgi:hypothetical protein